MHDRPASSPPAGQTPEQAVSEQAVSDRVETLCQRGCQYVNALLDKHRQGQPIDELADCPDETYREIIQILTDIMSVYTDKNVSP